MLAYVVRRLAYGGVVVLGVLFFLFLLFFTVTEPDDVVPALRAAMASGAPGLLDVRIADGFGG